MFLRDVPSPFEKEVYPHPPRLGVFLPAREAPNLAVDGERMLLVSSWACAGAKPRKGTSDPSYHKASCWRNLWAWGNSSPTSNTEEGG